MNDIGMNISGESSEQHLLLGLLFLCVFEEELVVDQLLDSHTISWVFLQCFVEKVPCLLADVDIGWNGNLILDYLDQFLLLADLEGILSHKHLVHHDAQRPNIDLLVILVSL
jgi:hypothetical protein